MNDYMRDIHNYDLFNVISLQGLPNSAYQPQLGVFGAGQNLETALSNTSFENILGIGHDYGGLVLRGMADGSNALTAVILDGVPNQGSNAIRFAIESEGTAGLSKAQAVIKGVQAIKGGDDCSDCQLVETFETWINELKANEAVFSQMTPNSDVIQTLNQTLPTVPYVILYGTKESFSITSLMSSFFFPNTGDDDHFTRCYLETLQRERQDAKDAIVLETIDNTLGFFAGTLNLFKEILENGGALTGITEHILSKKTEITDQIRAIQEKEKELARILRCELANQLLATEWQLALTENGPFLTEIVENVPTYNECLAQCEAEGWEDFALYFECIPNCQNNVTTVEVLVLQENDGLLTQSEQLLEGAVAAYHLENSNHFQETKRSNPVLMDHLQDIFDGAAGAAFVVPQL
ncbi:MAG: hypothetical protein D6714_00845 [Bacteroidetes bacterium]|nr:MAG: hypothetical protein D6714_00845 [Bacteroidota bacterium]